jgi:hypothetical protein
MAAPAMLTPSTCFWPLTKDVGGLDPVVLIGDVDIAH